MATNPETAGPPAILRQVFDAMPVGVAMFDRDLRVRYWNEAFYRFLADNEPALADHLVAGAALAEVSPFRLEAAHLMFQRALAGERVGRDAIPYTGPRGTTYWDIQLSPLIEDGEVVGVIDTTTESTARVAAIEVLRQREDQFKKVFEEISDGIILNDFETGNVAEANPAACRMHGYSREEFLGIEPFKFIHPDYWDALGAYQEAVRAGDDYYTRAKDVKKDGTVFDVEVMGSGIELEGKKYLLAVVRDISEQVALERQREESRALLEQRVEERTREIASLLDVSRTLLSTLDLDQLFSRLLEQIEVVIPYGGCSISVLRGDRIEMAATRNVIEPDVSLTAVGLAFGVNDVPHLWGAMLAHRPLLIEDVYGDTPEARDYRTAVGEHLFTTFRTVRSWLAVPLVHQGQVLGILSMSDNLPGAFTTSQSRLASAFANQAAVAVANARLYREVERRAREMEGLAGIAAALSYSQPAEEVLEGLAARVVEASSAVASSVTLYGSQGEYITTGVSGLPQGYVQAIVGDILSGAPSVTEFAFRTGERQILRNSRTRTLEDPRYSTVHQYLRGMTWETAVITPMVSRGRPQGTLDTYYPPDREPDVEELRLLSAIANQVAVAVENAQLFLASQQRVREMDALYRADERLHQSLVLGEVLQALTDSALDVLGADSSAVMVYEEAPPHLMQLSTASGLTPDQFDHLAVTLRKLETSGIRDMDVPRVVPDTSQDVVIVQEILEAVQVASLIDVPITIAGKRFGLFSTGWRRSRTISDEDIRVATSLAQRAAVAIENARLYERAQLAASLEERQRLARELHDSVSQALYGISLGTRTARTLLERDPKRVAEPLEYVSTLAEAGLAELRALIFELRPESLELEGLVAAFEKQFASLRARHNLEVSADITEEPDLRLDLKEALYRIGQEAMHNTVKHAKASQVWVTLSRADGQLRLEIRDNGIGFDPDGEFPGHLGLRSMAERAARVGGHFAIESSLGGGTTVSIEVPAIPGHLPGGTAEPDG